MSTGISLVLIAVGAILTFALETEVSGINIDAVGVILMIIGMLGLVISALYLASWSPYGRERRTTLIRERERPIDPYA
jgi:membrane-bound ClpP family serine protease